MYNLIITQRLGVESAADKRFQEIPGKQKASGVLRAESTITKGETAVQERVGKDARLRSSRVWR